MAPRFFQKLWRNTIAPKLVTFTSLFEAVVFPRLNKATPTLGAFIVKLYQLALGLLGFAIFIQFVRAGVTYLLAAGGSGEVNKAKDMMQNAVLGAILLVFSVLILNTINPDLTKLDLFDKNLEKAVSGASASPVTLPK